MHIDASWLDPSLDGAVRAFVEGLYREYVTPLCDNNCGVYCKCAHAPFNIPAGSAVSAT